MAIDKSLCNCLKVFSSQADEVLVVKLLRTVENRQYCGGEDKKG